MFFISKRTVTQSTVFSLQECLVHISISIFSSLQHRGNQTTGSLDWSVFVFVWILQKLLSKSLFFFFLSFFYLYFWFFCFFNSVVKTVRRQQVKIKSKISYHLKFPPSLKQSCFTAHFREGGLWRDTRVVFTWEWHTCY